MKVTRGSLLLAEPFLGDENFERSVVLICEHNEQGTFGLVLTQTTELLLDDVIEDDIYPDVPLFVGGPVEKNTLHYIHRRPDLIEGSTELQDGLFWSGDFEQIKKLLNLGSLPAGDIRFFIGYSGWGEGQLSDELNRDSWIVSNTRPGQLFDCPTDQLWRSTLRDMGGAYRVLSHYPTDPRLN
ncbi:YqgE/AlgH family protein [Siphonobacter sp.]|uniref:YqgE/AlgH family protein n=1 Tax=Siphonobacter sp. TaxID=1869184 RepID=UPI003B3BC913